MRMQLGIVGCLLLSALANTQTVKYSPKSGNTETMNKVRPGMAKNARDRAFFREAVEVNLVEIKLGEIAWKRGASSWAREYGRMMTMDHTQGFNELKVIGSKLKWPVSKNLSSQSRQTIDRLSRLRGSAFDAAYRRVMIDSHSSYSRQIEQEIKWGNNSLVRNFAITAGPVARLHLKMAERKVTKI